MKHLFLLATIFLTFSAVNAQIADVKIESGAARVYHEGDNYPSYSLTLDRDCEVSGFNTKYVVITCNSSVRIYKDKEYSCSYTISLDADCYVKNVTATAILIKAPGATIYYDFQGSFVKSTAD